MLIIGQIILHIITVVSASQLIQSTLGKYQPKGSRPVVPWPEKSFQPKGLKTRVIKFNPFNPFHPDLVDLKGTRLADEPSEKWDRPIGVI